MSNETLFWGFIDDLKILSDDISALVEFGFSEKEQLKELFETELPDFEIEFKDDLAGKPRMVHGRWRK